MHSDVVTVMILCVPGRTSNKILNQNTNKYFSFFVGLLFVFFWRSFQIVVGQANFAEQKNSPKRGAESYKTSAELYLGQEERQL